MQPGEGVPVPASVTGLATQASTSGPAAALGGATTASGCDALASSLQLPTLSAYDKRRQREPHHMMTQAERMAAADVLEKAERERVQATQLSTTWPHIDFDDAYAISAEGARRKVAKGAKIIGHKVGLTSKAMQRSSMIDEPDYGYLFDTLMIPDGGKARHDAYCLPRVEVELAFIMGKQLKGPGVNLTDVLRATDARAVPHPVEIEPAAPVSRAADRRVVATPTVNPVRTLPEPVMFPA